MFKFFLKGRKTNIGKDKLNATYSVALVMTFLAPEDKNQLLEDLPLANFGCLPGRLLLRVRTKSIN